MIPRNFSHMQGILVRGRRLWEIAVGAEGGKKYWPKSNPGSEASLQGCDRLSVSCSQIAVAHMQAADTTQIGR